jgi:hypothetical protein
VIDTAPRWADRAARLAVLTTVPSGLWRVALGVGVPLGFHGALKRLFDSHMPGWGTAYVIVLSALAETLAFLTVGLVRPWGRVAPRWLPWIGGRRIHPLAAAVPATLGAIAVTLITWAAALGGWQHEMSNPDSPHGAAGVLMTLCYAPLLLWGPLLGAVTVDFLRRSRA